MLRLKPQQRFQTWMLTTANSQRLNTVSVCTIIVAAAAPVNKRRRGFFTQPPDRASKGNGTSDTAAKPTEAADKGSADNVFRNVIHELRDRNLPVEMHYAHTEDGYWVPVVRVPAKGDRENCCC